MRFEGEIEVSQIKKKNARDIILTRRGGNLASKNGNKSTTELELKLHILEALFIYFSVNI